jgi:acetoin utilization protein AcuC
VGARPLLIASEIFRVSRHAQGHPLAIPRVSLTVDLCRALGWLPQTSYREAQAASVAEITRFHTPDYVGAVMRAEKLQHLSRVERERYNLGLNGNPIYGEVFRRPATACGASLAGARLLCDGGVVFNPAGGTHHGQRARASGYCIFNDPVLALLELLDLGLDRVVYLDLDAHFGDGVQQAFHDDPRVLTISVHEAGRWPMARLRNGEFDFGGIRDRAGGAARNLPVPAGFNDEEMRFLLDEAIVPLIDGARPEAIVVQCGADALADDPMTKLELSNGALWEAIKAVKPLAPRLLVLGGGGYNPWAVGRCWAGVWATLIDAPIPERLPIAAETLMRSVRWNHRLGRDPAPRWFLTLADPPRAGSVRAEVRAVAEQARGL